MHSPSLQIFPLILSILMLCANNGFGHYDNVYDMVAYPPFNSDNIHTTQDLLNSWNLACKSNTGGTVSVPSGTFLLKTITFKGPCNGPITFHVDGTLMAPSDPSFGEEEWIMFTNIDELTISGHGTFDGQGSNAWKNCPKSACATRPASLKFNHVKNAKIHDIRSINSKFFHFHITRCENFYVNDGVTISAPGDSPNTDGMHISYSNNVQVRNISIATGDDCISIGPGSTNINITSVNCGPGHGFSIGSLGTTQGETPVHDVTISDSTLTNTKNGVRIKTMKSSIPNSVSNITFQNIRIHDVENPIIIDQNYCPHNSCQKKGDSQVKINSVKFTSIKGISSSEVSVKLNCSGSVPCQGVVLSDLHLSYKEPQIPSKATCSHFNGTFNGNQIPDKCTNVN